MAEFVQTMKDWKRMCNAMGQEDEYTACDKCDLRSYGCPAIYENECNNADWNHVESVVTTWAAEHPGPVYPTWEQYLADLMTADMKADKTDNPNSVENYMRKTRIPDDIAQKLGLQPKEG